MGAFRRIVSTLDQSVAAEQKLALYEDQLNLESAQLAGASSVTSVTKQMNYETLNAAMAGMTAAMNGLHKAGALMNQTVEKMQVDLEEYRKEERTKAILHMALLCVDLSLNVAGPLFAASSEGAKVQGYTPFRQDEKTSQDWKGKETWRKGDEPFLHLFSLHLLSPSSVLRVWSIWFDWSCRPIAAYTACSSPLHTLPSDTSLSLPCVRRVLHPQGND